MLTGSSLGLQRSLHQLLSPRHSVRCTRLLRGRAFFSSPSNQSSALDLRLSINGASQLSPNSSEESSCANLNYQVRDAMRRVPHPLMIITATTPQSDVVGLLVSSFNTVSLHTIPVVSFNLKLPSSTFDAICASNSFSVTAASTAKMAQAFTKRNIDTAQTSNADLDRSRSRLDDGLFHMRCRWWKEKSVEIEDHMIMVGQVLAISHNPRWGQDQTTLIYSDGKYRHAGEPSERHNST